MRHDHESFIDSHTNTFQIACNCFCPDCYSEDERARVGQGCICPECVCQDTSPKKLAAAYYNEEVMKQPNGIRLNGRTRSVEDVPLPNKTPKSGTCKQCGEPTYRNGDRGRFPALCIPCRNK